MNPRTFSKSAFRRIIVDRPAMVRNLINPTTETIADTFFGNRKTFDYAPREWRNKEVMEIYIKLMAKDGWGHLSNLEKFPRRVRDSIDKNLVRTLMKKHCNAIKYFSMPYEDWIKYVSQPGADYSYMDIPEDTEEILVAAIKHNSNIAREIPHSKWTATLATRTVSDNSEVINHVPESLRTLDLYRIALRNPIDLSERIPEESCDQALADQATLSGNNLGCVPDKFKTRDMCLRCLKTEPKCFNDIPMRFRDEEMTIAVMTGTNLTYWIDSLNDHSDHPLRAENKLGYSYWMSQDSLLLNLAKKDQELWDKDHDYGLWGLENYQAKKRINNWAEIIKVSPISLKHLEKTNQTQEIIDAFFSSASIEVLDYLAQEHINLMRIKKDHAPFLIGCNNETLQGIAERKLGGPKKKKKLEDIKVTDDIVVLDLTDAEYRDILTKFRS